MDTPEILRHFTARLPHTASRKPRAAVQPGPEAAGGGQPRAAKLVAPNVPVSKVAEAGDTAAAIPADRPAELGGPSGPEPTRFGDWERNGRCSDF